MPTLPAPIRDLSGLLAALSPRLHAGTYVYARQADGVLPAGLEALMTLREPEGLTLIVDEPQAARHGLVPLMRAAWITLEVHSDLQAVGLTAAFARALADAGIACNVVAGAMHDHVFVPVEQASTALATLQRLQNDAATTIRP